MGNGCWFLHSKVDLTTQHILRKVSLFSIEVLSIWQRRHVLRKVHISLSLYNWTNMTCVEKKKTYFWLTSWQTRHVLRKVNIFFNWQVDKQDTCVPGTWQIHRPQGFPYWWLLNFWFLKIGSHSDYNFFLFVSKVNSCEQLNNYFGW